MTDQLCPLCTPALLERPRFQWRRYRNCSAHSQDIERYKDWMTSEVPTTQKSLAVAAAAEPPRSIIQRFEAAAQLLKERALNFTDDQERRFLEKFAELVELYEAEYPGEIPPLVQYDKNNVLMVRWPEGFSAKRLADIKRRKALAEKVGSMGAAGAVRG